MDFKREKLVNDNRQHPRSPAESDICEADNVHWVIPENFHTYTMDGFLEFRGQRGLFELEF